MENNGGKEQVSDHDLLIRLDEKMKTLIDKIEEIKNDTVTRVDKLENEKADAEYVNEIKRGLDQRIADNKKDAEDAIKTEREAREKMQADFEKRMRYLERFAYIAIGIGVLAQLLLPFAQKVLQ